MHKRVLVTGGAGFAGSHLCIALVRAFEGITVCALDNLKRRGSERNLDRLHKHGVRFIHGDIRNLSDLLSVTPEPDLIIECSAEPSAQAGYGGSPEYLINTNLTGCFHCLELARRTHADFVFLSTSRVYPYTLLNELPYEETETRFVLKNGHAIPGASERGINESFPLTGPRSLYGMTKLAGELLVQEFADAYGFRYIINRFGLLTGPFQMAKSDQGVIALWVAAHHFRQPLSYIGFGGTGKQVRDFLHVADFCDLVIDQRRHFHLYENRTWNAGGGYGNSLSLLEITRLCNEIVGHNIAITSVSQPRRADVRIYVTDNVGVTHVNGWKPTRNAEETIQDIHNWIIAEEDGIRDIILGSG